MQNEQCERVRIICLGNELVHDDGIGVRVGRVLLELDLPTHVAVEIRRVVGLELLDEFEGGEAILVIDASHTGARPGFCRLLELDVAAELARAPYCCHGMSLAEILEIARRISPDRMPRQMSILAIEAGNLKEYGTTLSEPVKEALTMAVDIVLQSIEASMELREEGKRRAEAWKNREIGIEDVM